MASGTEHGELDLLSLQEAADRLKVHYMTAYRWVRRGELPAFKAGGRLRVRASDVDRFVLDRALDVVAPTAGTGRTDWAAHLDRLHRLLVDGDAVEAGHLVRTIVADGAALGDVYLRLLAPAQHRVGEDWAAERISVAHEHRATEIVTGIVVRMGSSFRRRGLRRGTCVTLTPAGELHGLAALMASSFLRAGGYAVHHLGPNVPPAALARFLAEVPADVVCASATLDAVPDAALEDLVGACDDVPVVLGGQAVDDDRARAVGARHVEDLARLAATLDAVVAAR